MLTFPHALAKYILHGESAEIESPLWYILLFVALSLAALIISGLHLYKTAIQDIREAAKPHERKHPNRWIWFEAFALAAVFSGFMIIEMWIFASAGAERITLTPSTHLVQTLQKGKPDRLSLKENERSAAVLVAHEAPMNVGPVIAKAAFALEAYSSPGPRAELLTWFACSFLTGLILFLFAGLPDRIMLTALISVTFHEQDIKGVVLNSFRYMRHFIRAMILEHPLLLMGGVLLSSFFLLTPPVLMAAGRHFWLDDLTQADEIILAAGVFFAWFSTIAIAVLTLDETFGEYFNRRLANHLMMVQGHTVYVGFGSLGKRVISRQVCELHHEKGDKAFFEVVTPDMRLEMICKSAVLIEKNPRDVIFQGENSLLGQYGVVSTCEKRVRSADLEGHPYHRDERFLLPVVIGEAKEPFISSRVNLERARLIIGMVPDVESVQQIFERSTKTVVNAIIGVTRSDHISYLTYRARHRKIVLVYPKLLQGAMLGYRLWAAMIKMKAVRGLPKNELPKVLILGNNKANHYVLETVWPFLEGDYQKKAQCVREKFRFIVTTLDENEGPPMLRDIGDRAPFNKRLPESYETGRRYPGSQGNFTEIDEIRAETRVINDADVVALESCLFEFEPDILLINHDDFEKTSLMLSRCVRALERLKVRLPAKFQLPFVLLSTAEGNEFELLTLGDASRYYDAICKMYGEAAGQDIRFPSHARFDHLKRELIGSSISDSLSDAEEMIIGATRVLGKPETSANGNTKKRFVEVNGCMPNRVGSLAKYVARLAGMTFKQATYEQILEYWPKAGQEKTNIVYLPSFQFLRNIELDPGGQGLAYAGYATLTPLARDSAFFQSGKKTDPLAARIFANDGRNHIDERRDPDEYWYLRDRQWTRIVNALGRPESPGVPQIIARLSGQEMRRTPPTPTKIGDFRDALLNPTEKKPVGKYACPGMNICRIAAFQDYVLASNNQRMSRQAAQGLSPANDDLFHAKNYFCSRDAERAGDADLPDMHSPMARIFCCCHGKLRPGLIAEVLNNLLFQFKYSILKKEQDVQKDWVLNIEYFSTLTCQSPYFSLSRIFGFFDSIPAKSEDQEPTFPAHNIRFLPIGTEESARLWFGYAQALHEFLHSHDDKFTFTWMNQERKSFPLHEGEPEFDPGRPDRYPIMYVISKTAKKEDRKDPEKCEICQLVPKEYDCSKRRVWV